MNSTTSSAGLSSTLRFKFLRVLGPWTLNLTCWIAGTSNPMTRTPSFTKSDCSSGFMHGPHFAGPAAITVAVAVFVSVFPTGLSLCSTQEHEASRLTHLGNQNLQIKWVWKWKRWMKLGATKDFVKLQKIICLRNLSLDVLTYSSGSCVLIYFQPYAW